MHMHAATCIGGHAPALTHTHIHGKAVYHRHASIAENIDTTTPFHICSHSSFRLLGPWHTHVFNIETKHAILQAMGSLVFTTHSLGDFSSYFTNFGPFSQNLH